MWRIWSALTTLGVVVLMRWMFHAGRPKDDLGAVQRVAARVRSYVRETWRIVWRYYGPITRDMQDKWELLRESYIGGDYGVEGT